MQTFMARSRKVKPVPGMWIELTEEQFLALREYANVHGRLWKQALNIDWMNARRPGALQVIRNVFGPTWLTKFSFNDSRTWCVRWP